MPLCELARHACCVSTVEKRSGKVEAADFLIFHTPFRAWKSRKEKPQGTKKGERAELSVRRNDKITSPNTYAYPLSLSQISDEPLTLKRYAVTQIELSLNAYKKVGRSAHFINT